LSSEKIGLAVPRIPTVKFDSSRVNEAVKADIRKNILLLSDIDRKHLEQVYDAALRSISVGRDLHLLSEALMEMNIDGLTKRRAEDIARQLNNAATAVMDRERQESLGIKQAQWLYSGAPCEVNTREPTGQDAAHRAADGKIFEISRGMFLKNKWTWPGVEPGCKCVSKSIIPGFS
jgi:uncharacterized protein with gpF-like domain